MKGIIEKTLKNYYEVAEKKNFIYNTNTICNNKYKYKEEIPSGTHIRGYLEKLINKGAENISFFGLN